MIVSCNQERNNQDFCHYIDCQGRTVIFVVLMTFKTCHVIDTLLDICGKYAI